MRRVLLVLVSLMIVSRAEPPQSIQIDGHFDDWKSVIKRDDPSRHSIQGKNKEEGRRNDTLTVPPSLDASPLDGFPSVMDVHELFPSPDGCTQRKEEWNPSLDLKETTIAHDDQYVYLYVHTVESMKQVGNSVQLLLDVDNNVTTGYCSGRGGIFPSMCGVDMTVKVVVSPSTNTTEKRITLHSVHNATRLQEAERLIRNQGLVSFGRGAFNVYAQYAFWSSQSPPNHQDEKRCSIFTLPNGDFACFVGDLDGPLGGSVLAEFNQDGKRLEVGIPWAAFLNRAGGSGNLATLTQRQTIAVQVVTISQQPAASDAALPWAYELSPGQVVVSLEAAIVIPIATFVLGTVITTIIACVLHMRRNKSGYTDIQ